LMAKIGRDGYPAAFADLRVNDIRHRIAT